MLDITGAGAQLPMRSHWKLRPGPQSYLLCNSKQLSKRYKRGKQHKQHNSHRPPHPEPLSEHMVRRVVIRGMALTSPVTINKKYGVFVVSPLNDSDAAA